MNNTRSQFPILSKKINGQPLVYFDNAATSQKPQSVLDAINDFYTSKNSNVHRSMNPLAEEATVAYENSRKKVADFISANRPEEIVFTSGTTESINLFVQSFARDFLEKGDVVLLPVTEHHSNIIPWLQLKKEIGIDLKYIGLGSDGGLDYDQMEAHLEEGHVKIVSMAYISNALGVVFDIDRISAWKEKYNFIFHLDAAQAIPHIQMDIRKLNCDFLSFSGHKMFGPTGIGVLYGKMELLEKMPAWKGGGEMIREVFADGFTTDDVPHKFEAGTPNIAGAVGLAAAIDFLQKTGYDLIQKQEQELTEYLFKKLSEMEEVTILGPQTSDNHIPLYAFEVKAIHAHDVADILGESGICLRAGHHCTQLLHDQLCITASARASLAFYNTKEEIDTLITGLKKVIEKFK